MNQVPAYSGQKVEIVTIRNPPPGRYNRILNTVNKVFPAKLVTGTVVPTAHLSMGSVTQLGYTVLILKSLGRIQPAIVDIVASPAAAVRKKSRLVLDFRTPYPLELNWLRHDFLSALATTLQNVIKTCSLVFAANEQMAKLCMRLGAHEVHVLPNYPTKHIMSDIGTDGWKEQYELRRQKQIALFTGGARLREIYGLDLLLESWKKVEEERVSCFLVILGDKEVDYIRRMIKTLELRRVVVPGRVSLNEVVKWISCADVCLAPRTPGFPSHLYSDKDSTKISEYAALGKPIVATRYCPSSQYRLVEADPEAFAEGILAGLEGKIPRATPHFWEENESMMLKLLTEFWGKQ